MIKYVKDFENVNGNMQYAKIQEELQEAAYEYQRGDRAAELQELCDIINAVYSRFQQMGLKKEDIQEEMEMHYEKETLRGRKVIEIEGKSYKDNVVEQLLKTIAFMDKIKEENEEQIRVLNRQAELLKVVVETNKGE